jgi:hypothetical protein
MDVSNYATDFVFLIGGISAFSSMGSSEIVHDNLSNTISQDVGPIESEKTSLSGVPCGRGSALSEKRNPLLNGKLPFANWNIPL